jgi:hypothetical protein
MNALVGGDNGGITKRGGCSFGAVAFKHIAYAYTVSLGLVVGTVDAARVAGNCGLATQQLVLTECGDSVCMQQLCALFACCCRQIPRGAIISAIRRIAIAPRWIDCRNMNPDYHYRHLFR